ncbi:unnamed protein product [Rotaria sp. Silwood2]|nr:unnamed protein product [Rotaria sp. Silwood2]
MSKTNKGNYEKALQHYEHSYDMLINAEIPRVEVSAFVLNDIGSIFTIRGQYDQALEYYMHSIKISEDHSNYSSIAGCLGNIGIVYRIKGEYDCALDYQMKCLKMKEQYIPSEHKELARILNHIAAVYNDIGDLTNAMKYHQESLKMNEKCLPIGHYNIGSSLNHIAHAFTNQGKYDDALNYYMASLKIKETVFPNGHISIVKTLSKIGYTYYLKKDYNLAFNYPQKCMTMRENLFSDIHDINLVSALEYFSLVLIKQQKYDDALTYLMHPLHLAQTLLPFGHEDITDCSTNIGIVYREMGDYIKAFEYFEKASNNDNINPTKPSPIRLARNYENMGICLYDHGDDENGLKYRMKAARLINQTTPRSQHADWIDTIGNVFSDKKLFDNALECYLISLNMKLECLLEDHVDIAESFMYLGDVYNEKVNVEKEEYKFKAQSYYERALLIYQKWNHSNTVYIFNCIGGIYENIHEYRIAVEYYGKSLEMAEKYYPSNESVQQIYKNNIPRVELVLNQLIEKDE